MSFKRRLTGRCAIQKRQVGSEGAWMIDEETFVAPSTPVDLRRVPCFFYPVSGIEDNESNRVLSMDRVMFDFMRDVPVTREDRIKYNDEVYEIIRVSPVGGGHHLTVEAKQMEV